MIIDKAYYLTGYGTREQFAKLYKTIYQFPEFDIRYKLKDLAAYLNIQQILLVKMIQVFEELGFVTIKDGVMTVNKEAAKREIGESQIYQNLKQTVKDQEMDGAGYRARNLWLFNGKRVDHRKELGNQLFFWKQIFILKIIKKKWYMVGKDSAKK